MDSQMPMLIIIYAAALAPLVITVRVLRQRNRTTPASRAHWTIYTALIVARSLIVWCVAAAVGSVYAQFMVSGGSNLSATIQPYQPWPFTSSFDDATWPVIFATSRVDVVVAGLDVWTKIMIGTGLVLLQIAPAMLAAAVSTACSSVISGRPFGAGLDRVGWAGASVILVSGVGGQVLLGAGTVRAAETAIAWLERTGATDLPNPVFPTIELWPLYGALGLAVFAVLARYGTGYRRDVEGLV